MKKGGTRKVILPPSLTEGRPIDPGLTTVNDLLEFDVELVKIGRK